MPDSVDTPKWDFPLSKKSDRRPLDGVRIIDAGHMVSAPFSAVLMADLGADVIKVEHPEKGDGQRRLEPFKEGVPLWWKSVARNKRCVSVDLSKPAGAALFMDLIRSADVVMENFRPGTLEKWGLGYEQMRAVNEALILLRISGFGQTGPYRNRPGFGRIAEAMSGLSHLIGEPDGPPMLPGYPLGDLITGLFGAYATSVALYHRDAAGGKGQVIDLAMNEAVFRLLDFDPIQFDQLNVIHQRTGNHAAYVAPSSTYVTADGKYLTMAASTQSVWQRLCRAMDRTDLIDNPKFVDNKVRVIHSAEINGIVADWVSAHTTQEVWQRFEEHQVAFSPIFDVKDIFEDPHYRDRGALVRVPDSDLGEAVVQNVVPRFSRTPGSVDFLGADIGAHNQEILGDELGYSDDQLKKLQDDGVI